MDKRIALITGSIRKDAFSKKVALALVKLAPANFHFEEIQIGGLAMFNQDFDDENKTPEDWKAFRAQIKKCDGVLIVTPEYNRSYPAVVKNALDIGSRPYGQNAWAGKPGAVVSVSPGALGGFGANHHLRQVLSFLEIPVLPQPEAYIGSVMSLLNDQGDITKPETLRFLKAFMDSFTKWVNKLG